MPDARTMGDVQAAIDRLRELPYHNGKVGVIGYCSGGRQAYLAGCTLKGIDAAVSNYGGGVVAKPDELTERQPVAPIDLTKDMQCPILLLFGAEDTRPSPDDARKTMEALQNHGKTFEAHIYENAGHAFFAVDRPQYRVQAALEGWKKVFDWFGKYLHA
jgi:carboxymethylenebutenolidase